jgi:hypothetical protein
VQTYSAGTQTGASAYQQAFRLPRATTRTPYEQDQTRSPRGSGLVDHSGWLRNLHNRAGLRSHGAQHAFVDVDALVCLNCGNVNLVANDMATLRRAAEQHPERFIW